MVPGAPVQQTTESGLYCSGEARSIQVRDHQRRKTQRDVSVVDARKKEFSELKNICGGFQLSLP
jgi:hypothetical protein